MLEGLTLNKAPRWIEIVLAIAIIGLMLSWFSDQQTRIPTTAKEQQSTQADIKGIVQAMIFGSPATKVLPRQPIVKPTVVNSHLQLTLIGTILAGDKSAAIMMVGTTHQQKTFLLHDNIQQGVILKKVEKYAVIVNNHGKLERIVLKRDYLPESASKPLSKKTLRKTNNKDITQSITRAYISEQTNNFPKLLTQARVLPYIQKGKNHGFIISEITPHSLYQRIGLKNEDILQKVNGVAVTNVAQAMQMYQRLQNIQRLIWN